MIEEEIKLLSAIIEDQEWRLHSRKTVDEIAEQENIPLDRAYYFVNKWKFWNYGTSLRTGWIQDFNGAKEYLKDPEAQRRKI